MMNINIPLFFVSILFVSCKSSISCNEYFTTVPASEIKDLSLDYDKYETHFFDYHFTDLGTYDVHQIICTIRFDTVSHYYVVVSGYVVLKDIDQTINTQIVDSVKISQIAVKRKHHKLELFSSKLPDKYYNNKPWKDCPLPKSVRNKIKDDFLIRMKHRKYHLKTNERVIPVIWGYKLYE